MRLVKTMFRPTKSDEEFMGSAVRIPRALHDRLREISFETRISINMLMVALMELGLETVDAFDPNALTPKQRNELSLLADREPASRKKLIQYRLTFYPSKPATNGKKANV